MRGFWRVLTLSGLLGTTGWTLAQQKQGQQANPFPEDSSSIPLTGTVPGYEAEPEPAAKAAPVALPKADLDPARSPDDPEPDFAGNADATSTFSSSLKGTEDLAPPEPEEPKRRGKAEPPPKTQQQVADENVGIGQYYLQRKNWKAALARFQSAMVLDPENPEVFWGLAEAERNLGDFWNAKAHYEKLLDYDPDGPHGKAATKALKQPEIAGAQAATASKPAAPESK